MYILIVGTFLAVLMATPVYAQVHVDIGIHFPAPPPLVVVPETPHVQYVPSARPKPPICSSTMGSTGLLRTATGT